MPEMKKPEKGRKPEKIKTAPPGGRKTPGAKAKMKSRKDAQTTDSNNNKY